MVTEKDIAEFLSKLIRHESREILPSSAHTKLLRLQLTKFANCENGGESPLDCIRVTQICLNCHFDQSFEELHPIVDKGEPRNVYEFFTLAIVESFKLLKGRQSFCPLCNRKNELFTDVHHYQKNWGKDLVVRVFLTPRISYQVLWMNNSGDFKTIYFKEVPLFKKNSVELFVNAANAYLFERDLENCCDLLLASIERYPINKEIIALGYKLMNTNRIAISEYIAECFIRQEPDNSIGYTFKSHVYLKLLERGLSDSETLIDGAESACEKALSLEPHCAEAMLAKCKILKAREADIDSIDDAFMDLLGIHPGYTDAIHDYARHCLDIRPKEALSFFELGKAIDPDDPDFRNGILEALSVLDRIDEAGEYLIDSSSLMPQHPAVPDLVLDHFMDDQDLCHWMADGPKS